MKRTKRIGSVSVLVTLSALSAIGIILGKFLAFNITDFMRFSLENITIIFSGILFGPLLGAAVGAAQDLVGCIAVGYTINPIITLGSASIGAISGGIWMLSKKRGLGVRVALSVGIAHAVGSVLIKSVGLAVFYSLPFGITALWRILNYVIVGTLECVLLIILLKSKQLLSQINKITPFSPQGSFKTLTEAKDFAKNVSGVFSKPGLERVTKLLGTVGSPQKELSVVHVSGTNGKGSFVALLSSILSRSGLRVGSFTSPYLIEMRESIRIGGKPISEGELLNLFDRLRPIADGMQDKPTEFELLTAAAYLAFFEARVDIAIVECGMGAKRDATNVIDKPLLSVITGISIDHTAFLGSTEAEIAEEKAGVIKKGCPILIGDIRNEALEIIKAKASELNARLILRGEYSVKSTSLDGTVMDALGIRDLRLPLSGVHQPRNAALAITAAKELSLTFPTISDESIRRGIAETVWQARFEILSREPIFIYDGAHNLDGIKSAVESVRTYFDTRVIILTGVLADKQYELMADEISSVADTVLTITPENTRALGADDYASVFSKHSIPSFAEESVDSAVKSALALAKEKGLPIVCLGSLYIYSDVKNALERYKQHSFM